MAMSKLIAYLLPGILFDAILIVINMFCVSDETFYANWYGNLLTAILICGIVIPCVIYYVKMPPGENTKP